MSELIEFNLNGAWITLSEQWCDVTEEFPVELRERDTRLMLQREDSLGNGTLDLKVVKWKYRLKPGNLRGLLMEMCEVITKGKPFDYFERRVPTMICAASVDDENVFTRIWYCSNGPQLAHVAYLYEGTPDPAVLAEIQQMVTRIRFGKCEDEEHEEESRKLSGDRPDDETTPGENAPFGKN